MSKISFGVFAVMFVVAVCEALKMQESHQAHKVRGLQELYNLRPNAKSKRDADANANAVTCNFVKDFCKFMRDFNPNYEPTDNLISERMKSFVKCYIDVCRSNNSGESGHSKKYTKFCFMTEAEINGIWNNNHNENNTVNQSPNSVEYKLDAAATRDNGEYFSWIDKGAVTTVKDQGKCGNCYAFAAAGAVEGAYQIKCGDLYDYSTQQYTDCSYTYRARTVSDSTCDNSGCYYVYSEVWKANSNTGNRGCGGGDYAACWAYNNMTGIPTYPDECYPNFSAQSGTSGTCKYDNPCNPAAYVDNYVRLLQNETLLFNAVKTIGPVACMIDATNLITYNNGIVSYPGNKTNHAILVVGYGTYVDNAGNTTPYWIIKNSWGDTWGAKGFFFLQRGVNACNIGGCAYPIISQC